MIVHCLIMIYVVVNDLGLCHRAQQQTQVLEDSETKRMNRSQSQDNILTHPE